MMNGEPNEYELALRAREGDRDALAELVERMRVPLFALAYGELRHYDDAHDAVATALLKVCLHVTELREPARVGAWMQTIVKNEVRRLRRGPDAAAPLVEGEACPGAGEPSLSRLDIERALRQLPGDQARAIRLFYLADLSIHDIAERLGRSENTVKSWLHRGRRHLASHLESYAPMAPTLKAVLVHTQLETALARQVTDALRAAGYDPRVLTPADLTGVLEAVKGAHCIVLDEWVGGRSAFELVIHLKANPATREVPICLLCADPTNFTISTCWAAGVDRLVSTKSPEDMAQLEEAFRATHGRGAPATARQGKAAGPEAGISRRTLLKAAGAAAVGAAAIGTAVSPAGAATPQAAADGAIDSLQDLPLVPIRDKVYFPGAEPVIVIGRSRSVRAVEEATGGVLFLVAQKHFDVDDPGPDELYTVGVIARVLSSLRLPDGTLRMLVSDLARAQVTAYLQTDPYVRVRAEILPVEEDRSPDAAALIAHVSSQLKECADQGQTDFVGAPAYIANSDEAGHVADLLMCYLPVAVSARQEVLETAPPRQRLERVSALVLASASKASPKNTMWQRFTTRARRVVFFAQEEAARLGGSFVGPEHLLLGLLRESDSVACRILDRLDVSPAKIRTEIERQLARGQGGPGDYMQLTPEAKRVIDLAYEEARQLRNNYIGTEHLLLGLTREGEVPAARVLAALGANLQRVRATVADMQA